MNARLLLVALEREPDIVLVRKRTRRVAEFLGFDRQDQTRITTAVSELARNAFEYAGGGRAEFRVREDAAARVFEIIISEHTWETKTATLKWADLEPYSARDTAFIRIGIAVFISAAVVLCVLGYFVFAR